MMIRNIFALVLAAFALSAGAAAQTPLGAQHGGAASVKLFGAVCDGVTDDLAKINAALVAVSAVYIPADTTCRIDLNSAADGIKVPASGRLFGENRETSIILAVLNFTPTYDFVTNGRFTNITVLSNVATVRTGWSHELKVGQTVSISGSATTGLNGTKTITGQTAPDTFTFTTSGVSNGTYTDPTHLTGNSGIGVAIIRASTRDDGNPSSFSLNEIDHFSIKMVQDLPFTYIDMTGMWGSRVHDITLTGGTAHTGQIGVVCADKTPSNADKACFFNHVHDMYIAAGTALHWSSATGNAGTNMFDRWHGGVNVVIDTTGGGVSQGAFFTQFYFSSDGIDSWSWDLYPNNVGGSVFAGGVGCEGCNHNTGYNIGAFAIVQDTVNYKANLPGLDLVGPLALPYISVPDGTTISALADSTVFCESAPTNVTLPANPARNAPAGTPNASGGQVLTFRAYASVSNSCVIHANSGQTIEGGSSLTVYGGQTMTIQWDASDSDWRIIVRPEGKLITPTVGSLPTCDAGHAGIMYAVSDQLTTPTYRGALTGGGSINVPVYCDGSAWLAH